MNNNHIMLPSAEEDNLIETILSSIKDPYKVLRCNKKSTNIEINNNYNELLVTESDDPNYIDNIKNAYKILGNERLRELYDTYHANPNLFIALSGLSIYVIGYIFKNIKLKIYSQTSNGNAINIIYNIYKEKGFSGFTNRFFSLILIDYASNSLKLKMGVPKNDKDIFKIKLNINQIIKIFIIYHLKHLANIIIIAPIKYSPTEIINQFIFNKFNIKNIIGSIITIEHLSLVSILKSIAFNNIKNILLSIGYGFIFWCIEIKIKDINQNFKELLKYISDKQTNNRLYSILNYVFNDSFLGKIIDSTITLPVELLHFQYNSILFTNELIVPNPLNPISMTINLLNSINRGNTLYRLSNAFVTNYVYHQLLEFSFYLINK